MIDSFSARTMPFQPPARRPPRARPALLRYGAGLLGGLIAIALGDELSTRWQGKLSFVTFYTVLIVASAWYGGLWAGLLCTALSGYAAAYFWLDPPQSFKVGDAGDVTALVMFLGIGAAISLFSEQLHKARRREEEAREQAERAAAAERSARQAREEVLAIVAHDLRGPLGAIDMSAAVLERTAPAGGAGDPTRARTAVIHRTVARMSRLIDDLLDSASLDAGQLSLRLGLADPRELLAESAEQHARAAEARIVTLEIDAPDDLPTICCDRARIVQVLSNLIGNALKFTPEGGLVRATARACDGSVEFRVSDTGCGIPADRLPHIFERYWHAERAAGGGTGLGLYICRGLVEAHGGTLTVRSAEGRGATFSFTLPEGTPP
jgi:signal transduction histidine kinase